MNDLASKTLDHVKAGFGKVGKELEHAKSATLGFMSHTASTALGVSMAGLVPTIENWGHAAIEAAISAGREEKSLAAAQMMTDRKGRSYQSLREDAVGLRKELREMGQEAGISGESMVDSFGDIAARSTKSKEGIVRMMGEMAQAGRVVPGGLESITRGFEMIEMGVIRARNPVVMLVASSGLLAGNAKQVAAQMQKMAPEKQMELADKAISRMASKMKGIPLSFGESVQAMKDMKEDVFEMVGAPVFKAFVPVMRSIQSEFKAHKEDIEAWAGSIGASAGTAVAGAAEKVKELFSSISAHWGDISSAIHTASDAMMGAAKFVVDNKETMIRAFGASQTKQDQKRDPGHHDQGQDEVDPLAGR